MADDGNGGGGIRSMDLNLYLGPPRSARPRSLDLGSDLALGSSSFSSSSSSSSSSTEGSRVPPATAAGGGGGDGMSGRSEPSVPDANQAPSHAPFTASPNISHAVVDPTPPPPSAAAGGGNTPSEYPPLPSSYSASAPLPLIVHAPANPDSLNSLSHVQVFPTMQASDEPLVGDGYLSYIPLSPLELADEALAGSRSSVGSDSSHVPYSQIYVSVSMTRQGQDEAAFTPYPPIYVPMADATAHEDGSSSRQDLLQNPEFRLRRLIELHCRWRRVGRFRSSPQRRDESPNFAASSRGTPELERSDILVETSGKCKAGGEGTTDEGLVKEEKNGSAVNFECNICLDIAKDPIVTSCGHLFCWPCLYQWLHLHCDHKECPVCKGEVTESNIIPIYGRGSTEAEVEKKGEEDSNSGLKIPPRPHGCRLESWRQQIQRPISRRLGEGIVNSWRRVFDRERHSGNRLDVQGEPSMVQGIIDGAHHRVLTRLRARRLIREGDSVVSEFSPEQLPGNASSNPQDGGNTSYIPQDETDIWQQLPFSGFPTERLASISADLTRIMSRFASSSNRSGVNTSSPDPHNSEDRVVQRPMGSRRAADQASASSTMAVIQGDTGFADASAEPNSAGSSRLLRRRRRGNTSGSLDVDGGDFHARKRRRLN